jgi:hypothetical protein
MPSALPVRLLTQSVLRWPSPELLLSTSCRMASELNADLRWLA